MAYTWAICDILGNGRFARSWTDSTGPYRAAVHDLGPYRALIPPGTSWCLVVSEADPALLAAEKRCDVLTSEFLDRVLTAQKANVVNNALNKRGIAVSVSAGMTYREAIEVIAHALDPSFTVDWFPGVT